MTYKSIYVVASGSDDDEATFKAAAALASLHEARLTVVSAFMPPAVQMAYVVPPNLYLDPALIEELQQGYDGAKALVKTCGHAAAAHAGLELGKTLVVADYDTEILESAASWGPVCDLAVVGPSLTRRGVTADLLLDARLPVLVARPDLTLKPMVAAIAWDGGMNAGRAVRAAMPLLKTASRIVLLQQAEALGERRRKRAEPARLADYLQLHGYDVVTETIGGEQDSGEAIVDAAHCCGADVLICGAYGHARVAEMVLGGVTRSVLNAAFPSVLLAH